MGFFKDFLVKQKKVRQPIIVLLSTYLLYYVKTRHLKNACNCFYSYNRI